VRTVKIVSFDNLEKEVDDFYEQLKSRPVSDDPDDEQPGMLVELIGNAHADVPIHADLFSDLVPNRVSLWTFPHLILDLFLVRWLLAKRLTTFCSMC
jgi:hypothetical protein